MEATATNAWEERLVAGPVREQSVGECVSERRGAGLGEVAEEIAAAFSPDWTHTLVEFTMETFSSPATTPARRSNSGLDLVIEGIERRAAAERATESHRLKGPVRSTAVNQIDWLLDADPAIRWQVMSDLLDAAPADVASERARVAVEGWGAELLALQAADGRWDGGTYRPGWVDEAKPFFDAWTATHFVLQLLRELGLPPESPEAQDAVGRVRDNVRWDANDALYFDGETEPCVNGIALANGAYFGESVDVIVERLLADQLADDGWNCWAEHGAKVSSFHTTICVLEGLAEWEKAGGSSDAVAEARRGGEEYLLERGLLRGRSSGQIIDPRFTMFSFPTYWYYDVLRALDYLLSTGAGFDERCSEAIELVAAKRSHNGRWRLENIHQGPTHLEMDDPEGFPSRWITLRAARVLEWAGAV